MESNAVFTNQRAVSSFSCRVLPVFAAMALLNACGTETPAEESTSRTSGSTQVTQVATPPTSSSSSAQASSTDGVLAAIQGNFQATLEREVDGTLQTQTLSFSITQRTVDGIAWPVISVLSTGALGDINFGSYMAWELYGSGGTYALVSPAMTIPAISEDFTVALELLLTLQSNANGSKTLVPAQSAILIKDCGFFDGVFASCSNTLRDAAMSGNSFQKL
jgi:hypothetical protein